LQQWQSNINNKIIDTPVSLPGGKTETTSKLNNPKEVNVNTNHYNRSPDQARARLKSLPLAFLWHNVVPLPCRRMLSSGLVRFCLYRLFCRR